VEDLDDGVNVAVIGAGWAGMAAAVKLAQSDIPVTVFEGARHVGGRARSVEIEGIALDNGQHLLIGAYGETLALMRAVGADPEQLLLRVPLAIEYPGKFSLRARRLPAPWHLLAALLCAHGLTLREKLAAVRFMEAMRRCAYRIARDLPVSDLLARHGQNGALARFIWEPLCVSALNTPAALASAQVFLNVLRDALASANENSDFLIPRAALGKLFPEPAAAFVCARGGAVRLGTAARKLERAGSGYVLGGQSERYSHVIVAVGPHQLGPVLNSFPELATTRQCIANFAYEPIYTCYLQYPTGVCMPRPVIGLDSGIVQWIFDRGQIAGRAGLLAAVISARSERLPLETVASATQRELTALLPGLPGPLWTRVIAERRATFSCRPDIERPAHETALANLYLAGDYVAGEYPATLEAAVRSGIRAAELVHAHA